MTPQSPMVIALAEAEAAARRGEVPVGAVIIAASGAVLAQDGNRTLELRDPTAHAEMLVIRAAAKALGSERLTGCSLYVTLEPCAMCAAAISFARVARLYFGAGDDEGGAVEHGPRFFAQPTCHHAPESMAASPRRTLPRCSRISSGCGAEAGRCAAKRDFPPVDGSVGKEGGCIDPLADDRSANIPISAPHDALRPLNPATPIAPTVGQTRLDQDEKRTQDYP